MRNCFNNILIALNVCDSLHLIFAIMDAFRNSFGEKIGALDEVKRLQASSLVAIDTYLCLVILSSYCSRPGCDG